MRHLAMVQDNSICNVVTERWEKAKRRGDEEKEEARNLRHVKRQSIRTEMVRHGCIIVDYSDTFDEEDTE
jgi:hypothetical protein